MRYPRAVKPNMSWISRRVCSRWTGCCIPPQSILQTTVSFRSLMPRTMLDNGEYDEKIIAVPTGDPTYKDYNDVRELPKHIFEEMMHFFSVYKFLEQKVTEVKEICGREEAVKIIQSCIKSYSLKFGK